MQKLIGLSKRLLTSSLFIAPIETFIKGKTNIAIKEKKCNTSFAPKEQIVALKRENDVNESHTSHSHSGNEEMPSRKSSKCRLRPPHRKAKDRKGNYVCVRRNLPKRNMSPVCNRCLKKKPAHSISEMDVTLVPSYFERDSVLLIYCHKKFWQAAKRIMLWPGQLMTAFGKQWIIGRADFSASRLAITMMFPGASQNWPSIYR